MSKRKREDPSCENNCKQALEVYLKTVEEADQLLERDTTQAKDQFSETVKEADKVLEREVAQAKDRRHETVREAKQALLKIFGEDQLGERAKRPKRTLQKIFENVEQEDFLDTLFDPRSCQLDERRQTESLSASPDIPIQPEDKQQQVIYVSERIKTSSSSAKRNVAKKKKAVSKKQKDSSPVWKDTDCKVCLLEVDANEDVFTLQCGHEFHLKCCHGLISHRINQACTVCQRAVGQADKNEIREKYALMTRQANLREKRMVDALQKSREVSP